MSQRYHYTVADVFMEGLKYIHIYKSTFYDIISTRSAKPIAGAVFYDVFYLGVTESTAQKQIRCLC